MVAGTQAFPKSLHSIITSVFTRMQYRADRVTIKYHLLSLLRRKAIRFISICFLGNKKYFKGISSPTNPDKDIQRKIADTPLQTQSSLWNIVPINYKQVIKQSYKIGGHNKNITILMFKVFKTAFAFSDIPNRKKKKLLEQLPLPFI